MKNGASARAAMTVLCGLLAATTTLADSTVVDGVLVARAGSDADSEFIASPSALTSSSIDFDTPELFSDTLPLQIFQTVRAGAIFFGKGAVLDAASFEVTGTSGTSVLAFNGRTAVNGDGSIPRLPEHVLFVGPNRLRLSRKQRVSVNVGSKRDEGKTVRLVAYDSRLRVVGSDAVQLAPQMQTLTVTASTPSIILVALRGDPDLEVLAVDNLVYE